MSEDCYFFVHLDKGQPEDEARMAVLCVECHNNEFPDLGWFWRGSQEGYGPYDYVCKKCGKVIHRGENEEEQDEEWEE